MKTKSCQCEFVYQIELTGEFHGPPKIFEKGDTILLLKENPRSSFKSKLPPQLEIMPSSSGANSWGVAII